MGQNLDTIPYFRTDSMPNAGIYLPAPPDTCSQLFIDDFQQWLWGKSMRHTPRGQQASWESLYSVDRMCGIYSEALGFVVSREATPAIYRLISRGQKAAAQAVDPAKAKYMRKRPFARMNEHVAGAFDDEEELRLSIGAYVVRMDYRPHYGTDGSRIARHHSAAWMGVWRKSRHCRGTLAERCRCSPAGCIGSCGTSSGKS